MNNTSPSIAEVLATPFTPVIRTGALDYKTPSLSYQLNLTNPSSSLRLTLNGLDGNANLKISNQSGTYVQESKNAGNLSEVLMLSPLDPDVYTVEVSLDPTEGVANYKLTFEANADAELSNLLWRNSIEGTVGVWQMKGGDIANIQAVPGVPLDWRIERFADLNNDGEDDLIWRSRAGNVGVWLLQNGKAIEFKDYGNVGNNWQIMDVADLDGNGAADVLWREQPSGMVGYWMMDGVTLIDAGIIDTVSLNWKLVKTADINGDRIADYVWRSDAGDFGFWTMKNSKERNTGASWFVGNDWQAQFYGDLNKDGNSDVVWRNVRSGEAGFWLMNGSTPTPWATASIGLNWQVKGLGDFNGDGADDLLWQDTATQAMGVWLTRPDGLGFTEQNFVMSPGTNNPISGLFAGVGDFNNDGKTDIAYRNEAAQTFTIAYMNGLKVTSQRVYSDIPTAWKVLGVLKQDLLSMPYTISGQSAATAFDMGTLNDKGNYSDAARQGEDDYFKFKLVGLTKVNLSIPNPAFKIEYYRAGKPESVAVAQPDMLLDPGEYVVRVSTTRVSLTPYTLEVEGIPQQTNLVATKFIPILTTPTLRLKDFDSPDTANTANVAFSIKNSGPSEVGNFKVAVWASRDRTIDTSLTSGDVMLREFTVNQSLAPGEIVSLEGSVTLPDTLSGFWFVDGNYYLGLKVDSGEEINEDNENDNLNGVIGRGRLELPISNTYTSSIVGSYMEIVSGEVKPGETLTIKYRVKNIGNKPTQIPDAEDSGTLYTVFYLSSDTVLGVGNDDFWEAEIQPNPGTPALGGAQQGAKAEVEQTITIKLPDQNWSGWATWSAENPLYLGSYVNYSGKINEVDSTDNVLDPSVVGSTDPEKPDTIGKNYLILRKP